MSLLCLKSVCKSFGGLQAVKQCSFNIDQETIVCLIGPNGAGKTTIFNLITGFLKADKGSILYHKKDITNFEPHEVVRRGISRGWQGLRLFHKMTVLGNVLLAIQKQRGEHLWEIFVNPLKVAREQKENQRKALACLERVGLIKRANILAGALSYGEQKLLSLARLISSGGDLFLLDEPIAGLDPRSATAMSSLIKALVKEGKTICLVEHNLEMVKDLSDHIIFLDQGQVIAEGTIDSIVNNPHLTNIYFGQLKEEA